MKNYTPKGPFHKVCKQCGIPFEGVCNQLYHSQGCARLARYGRTPRLYPELSTGKIGAISELRVCADLLAKGYDIFRAVSPSCPCDLVAFKQGTLKRIEVRTATKTQDGELNFPLAEKDRGRFDHLAAVLKDEIIYVPEL